MNKNRRPDRALSTGTNTGSAYMKLWLLPALTVSSALCLASPVKADPVDLSGKKGVVDPSTLKQGNPPVRSLPTKEPPVPTSIHPPYDGVVIRPGDVIDFVGGGVTVASAIATGAPMTYGHTSLYLGVDKQGVRWFLDFTTTKDLAQANLGRILSERAFFATNSEHHPSFDIFRLEGAHPRLADQNRLLFEARQVAANNKWFGLSNVCSTAAAEVLAKVDPSVKIKIVAPDDFAKPPFQKITRRPIAINELIDEIDAREGLLQRRVELAHKREEALAAEATAQLLSSAEVEGRRGADVANQMRMAEERELLMRGTPHEAAQPAAFKEPGDARSRELLHASEPSRNEGDTARSRERSRVPSWETRRAAERPLDRRTDSAPASTRAPSLELPSTFNPDGR